MLKTILHALMIVLVAGLVAGGIYLLVEQNGASLLGASGLQRGGEFHEAGALPDGAGRPAGHFTEGDGRASGGRGGEMGVSLQSLGGVFVQVAKIALITGLVLAARAVVRRVTRRRAASPAAV